jgi:AcrR family transcriptional regulator
MRKGELKKQEFLRASELRFCRDGYENTSIQEILDDLHTSKGSFYHHFVSKEALLEEICRSRAESNSRQVLAGLDPEMDPCSRLNVLISGMIPFSGEKLSFLLMLIPVLSGPEGVRIRNCYSLELENLYKNKTAETLREGMEKNVFACRDCDFFAGMLLEMINRFWLEICDRILDNEKSGRSTDPQDLMTVTENYRTAVERLLSAPYGSVNILKLQELQTVADQIHLHWKK